MKDTDTKAMKKGGHTPGKDVALRNLDILMILCCWTVA